MSIRESWIAATAEIESPVAGWCWPVERFSVAFGGDTTLFLSEQHAAELHTALGRALAERMVGDPFALLRLCADQLDGAGYPDGAVMLRALLALLPAGVTA